jgi:PAS domain S-box-containing protein
LRVWQQTFGALSLHRRAPHAYDRGDIEWAQDLAQRIALAIEAARLYADARRLFEQSASANWVTTPDGRILACNQMFAQLLGFGSIDEVLRVRAVDLFVDSEDFHGLLDDLTAHRRVSDREAPFRRHDDGRIVHALVTVILLGTRVLGMFVVMLTAAAAFAFGAGLAFGIAFLLRPEMVWALVAVLVGSTALDRAAEMIALTFGLV